MRREGEAGVFASLLLAVSFCGSFLQRPCVPFKGHSWAGRGQTRAGVVNFKQTALSVGKGQSRTQRPESEASLDLD